jgi:nucleotide-binding universal stress UspA family protein
MTNGPLFQRILICADGSEYSLRAAETAFGLAHTHSGEVHVLAVMDSGILSDFRERPEKERLRVERDLKLTAENHLAYLIELATQRGLEVQPHLRTGRPHIEIINLANEIGIELIVIGKHGRQSIGRIMRRDVAERVFEDADCSVLVVI